MQLSFSPFVYCFYLLFAGSMVSTCTYVCMYVCTKYAHMSPSYTRMPSPYIPKKGQTMNIHKTTLRVGLQLVKHLCIYFEYMCILSCMYSGSLPSLPKSHLRPPYAVFLTPRALLASALLSSIILTEKVARSPNLAYPSESNS